MSSARSQFLTGLRDVVPVLPGFFPFGMITGIAAVNVGMTAVEAVSMSALMFAGAAQLAALELLSQDVALSLVVLTALVINLRFMMFSASLAPYFRPLSVWWKWPAGFFLSTPSYVLSVAEFEPDDPERMFGWYYFGSALPVWLNWQVATAAGVLLGARIPAGWQLDFAVPLVFMTLLFTAIEDRTTKIAGLSAGLVAVAGANLPLNLGLVLAALGGVAVGLAAELWVVDDA